MKRKASHLDGGSDSNPWTSISPRSDSSVTSFDSPDRIFKPVPWMMYPGSATNTSYGLNSRTRKRFRDNRPDINTIHQSTLTKLYNAQRAEQPAPSDIAISLTPSIELPTNHDEAHQPAPTQKSLHAFFNIRQPMPVMAKLASSTYQHVQHLPELCGDCGSHLSSQSTGASRDHDRMDVDNQLATFLEEDYSCAACQKHVCDMCAVRGDQRICLECALPGGG